MTEYVGALKECPALELGAIAARGAFQKTGVNAEWVDHVVHRQRAADERDAIYGARHVGAESRRAHRSPGADRQPAVRLRHSGGGQRRAA